MTHPVDNSHFIAKGLTRPWEFTHPKRGGRQLWYFDFDRDCFAVSAAKDLYTTEVPWPRDVEDFLNKLCEDPLPKFLARFRKDGKAEPTAKQLFAMKATLFLQVERTQSTIHETAAKGEEWVRQLIEVTDLVYDFVHVPMPKRQLCFPEHGFFLIPLIGIKPIMAMPLDPSFFVMAVPKPSAKHIEQVIQLRDIPHLMSGLTIGLDRCRRVVVPGELYGKDEAKLAWLLKHCRTKATAWVQSVMDAHALISGQQSRRAPAGSPRGDG